MTMLELVRQVYAYVARPFRRPPPRPTPCSDIEIIDPQPVALPQPIVEPQPVAKVAPFRRASELPGSGEFFFRETILDQLDYYMRCIARMKRADPQSFAIYSRLGAQVVPEDCLEISRGKRTLKFKEEDRVPLSPWFRQALPAFGAIFYGKMARDIEREEKWWVPRFVYFRKYDRLHTPPEIQRPSQGAVYVMTVYWDNLEGDKKFGPVKRKHGVPQDYPVVVLPDGTVKMLRSKHNRVIRIRHKHGRDRGTVTSFKHAEWRSATPWLIEWARDHKEDPEHFLAGLFIGMANMFETSHASVIRVGVTKGDLTATFGVDIKRTPYFFKDREIHLTDSGRRKRIFHIVRPHSRLGRFVKMHFRGERLFVWNGYRVVITVPGRHHHHLNEFDVGLHDGAFNSDMKNYVTTKEMAEKWKRHIERSEPYRVGR